jgi:nucleoside phosphorylase
MAAAATAVSLIRDFGVTEIIFSGLAGGLVKHVCRVFYCSVPRK